MIPGDRLADIASASSWAYPMRDPHEPLQDTEMGGIALGDASLGLLVKPWHLRYEGTRVLLSDGDEDIELFSRPGLTRLALAFDTNMAPFVAFEDAGGVAWWADPGTGTPEFSGYLPAGSHDVCCTLDDKRELMDALRDILVVYLRGGNLYYRQQRDNYNVERLLRAGEYTHLLGVGMNRNLSLQFWLFDSTG